MSHSNRLSYRAIGRCLIVSIVCGIVLTIGGPYAFGAPDNKEPPKEAEQQQQGTTTPDTIATPVKEQAASPKYDPKCTGPKDHDEADFCAQSGMAKAANEQLSLIRKQNRLASAQNWITGVEAFFLVLTVLFTAIATKAANVAAAAAAETARAAIVVERGRFYVSIEGDSLGNIFSYANRYPNSPDMHCDPHLEVRYRFVNLGKTPAVIREIHHGIAFSGAPIDPVYTLTPTLEGTVIAANEMCKIMVCRSTLPDQTMGFAQKFVRGEMYVWFFGTIEYIDVFEQRQIHRFYFRYIRDQQMGGGFFQPIDYKHYNKSS